MLWAIFVILILLYIPLFARLRYGVSAAYGAGGASVSFRADWLFLTARYDGGDFKIYIFGAEKKERDIEKKESGEKPAGAEKAPKKASVRGIVKRFWSYPGRDEFMAFARDKALALWREIRPKSLKISGVISAGDPADTGTLLGAAAALSALLRLDANLSGDFEGNSTDLRLSARGKFTAAGALWPIAAFALSEKTREALRHFRKKTGKKRRR
ncbi:MAG: hypothetical protein LBU36_07285 [Clostridiales bacterium]|nr:hypothetical protein [Clostridiales bacterium]